MNPQELRTLLIDRLVCDILLVLSKMVQDAGEYSRVTRISCVLLSVMSSATKIIVIPTAVSSTSTVAGFWFSFCAITFG